ncbi:MAG: UvrD-helicase domain-containing protein, partial [Ilumatobacteraceae bacterium]
MAEQLPLLLEFDADRRPDREPDRLDRADATAPPDAAARDRIRTGTTATLFVEAGAGAGKTTALVGRILTHIDDGVPIDEIAAITFTEKAAAELRHRLRERLSESAHEVRLAAVDALDHAPIGTLHAFARRILFELPVEAGLPPGVGVLDELESQLALDERWEDLMEELLDDADTEIAPGLRASELVQLCTWPRFGGTAGLRRIVEDFQDNWDLVAERVSLTPPERPGWCTEVLTRIAGLIATPVPPDDSQAALLAEIRQVAAVIEHDGDLSTMLGGLETVKQRIGKGTKGNKAKWRGHGGVEALDALRAEELALVELIDGHLLQWREYRRLVVGAIAGRFVLDGARERAAAGTLEFHDLLVLARRLLTGDPGARRRLHQRYRRVLLDEFQDTDPIQLEIAVRLTAAPDAT